MMLEARDRLARPVDIAASFARQRSTVRGIYVDSERDRVELATPIRQGHAPAIGTPGNGGFTTPGAANMRGRSLYGSPVVRRQNSPAGSSRRARGRFTNSALPSWYPRTPLRDITAIMRAIERRRAQLREIEGQETQISSPEGSRLFDSSSTGSSAQLEHSSSTISPISTAGINNKPYAPPAGKVPKTFLRLANESSENSECLTPQKQLLNSIDTVEKIVKEELQKFKRTPTAKKAEREKRVRTLMSMR